jgi:hypothetical protein
LSSLGSEIFIVVIAAILDRLPNFGNSCYEHSCYGTVEVSMHEVSVSIRPEVPCGAN